MCHLFLGSGVAAVRLRADNNIAAVIRIVLYGIEFILSIEVFYTYSLPSAIRYRKNEQSLICECV